jgi:WD40 repeat protein
LYCKGRFSTGHQKPIDHTLLLNRTSLATLSKDRKIVVTDLIQESTVAIINTSNEDPLSACQVDYNSLIYGGSKATVSIVDIRSRKFICDHIELKGELMQLTKMTRFSDH